MTLPALAQDQPDDELSKLPWVSYPSKGDIASVATIDLKDNLYFLGEKGTTDFLVMNGNPSRTGNYTLAPESLAWFAVFSFEPSGYVTDDDTIDAPALLASLKEGNLQDIEERKKLGLSPLSLIGWTVEPHYDEATHFLEWGTLLKDSDGFSVVNYSVRILGRSGVMTAILVSDPETLDENIVAFHKAVGGYEYVAGERYGEFRQGDKLAGYGLTALIAGGAAAAVLKPGLLKTIGVAIFAGGAALLAGIGAFFRRFFRKPKA